MNKLPIYFILSISSILFYRCTSGDPEPDVPMISISNVEISEGETAMFVVSMDRSSDVLIEFSVITEDNTAVSGEDYEGIAEPSMSTINPGDSIILIPVNTLFDQEEEENEEFVVKLANSVNASIANETGTGTIVNVAPALNFYMEAKINDKPWKAITGGLFYPSLLTNIGTLAGYGMDGDSQLSFFIGENVGAKVYGIDPDIGPDIYNDIISVSYTPHFFSSGGLGTSYFGQTGGELKITNIDWEAKTASGTFQMTVKDENGNEISITEGKFFVPVE